MRIVSYGGGTNSTAMLIECANRGIEVDLILFADTGGEKPHTYNYIKIFSEWLVAHGLPEIITVKKGGNRETLEEACLRKSVLPSIAYGWKTCSSEFKIGPQVVYLNNWSPAREVWARKEKIIRVIGFDADEPQRADAVIPDDQAKKYDNWYPLIEWDMGRDECIETIEKAGLCLPGKSSCFFCPSIRPTDIKKLAYVYPELMDRAIEMERRAGEMRPGATKGLGRSFAWVDVIATDDMFSDDFAMSPELLCGCYDGD